MALADLKNVLKIFGGSEITEDKQNELFKEVLLMTLARAANADINVHTAEVDKIQAIIKEHTGEEMSAAEIRVAARPELYAEASLIKYLSSVRGKLKDDHRGETIRCLAEVMRSDDEISLLEVDFFNHAAQALGVTPAQIAGLI